MHDIDVGYFSFVLFVQVTCLKMFLISDVPACSFLCQHENPMYLHPSVSLGHIEVVVVVIVVMDRTPPSPLLTK